MTTATRNSITPHLHASGCYAIRGDRCEVILVNPDDRDWTRGRFLMQFGGFSALFLCVWANGLESALEESASWLEDNAPGVFITDYVAEEFHRVRSEHPDWTDEQCEDEATMDCTYVDGGLWLDSSDWYGSEIDRKGLFELVNG